MGLKVRLSPRAVAQLATIRDYVSRQNPAVADIIRLRILSVIKRLQSFPEIGHPGCKDGTREIRASGLPFVIVYRVDSHLTILGIFHTAQMR